MGETETEGEGVLREEGDVLLEGLVDTEVETEKDAEGVMDRVEQSEAEKVGVTLLLKEGLPLNVDLSDWVSVVVELNDVVILTLVVADKHTVGVVEGHTEAVSVKVRVGV